MAAPLGLAAARDQRAVSARLLGSRRQSMAQLVRDRHPSLVLLVLFQSGRRICADGVV